MLNEQQLFGQLQTSQTGGQSYSDKSPYDECSLDIAKKILRLLSLILVKRRSLIKTVKILRQ